ncbi:MAG: amidohydrolase family protein [Pseudomonadota bacterium]
MKKLAILAALLLTAAAPPPAIQYDIVIRNGRVLDGAGNPWVRADVAIKDGRIAAIGKVGGRGTKEIEAHDRYVTPGFIDMMDQSGTVLLKNGDAESKLRQGVTTLIAGEGGTPVPAAEIPAYLDTLDRQGIAVNFATYYSAMQAREKVMGDGAGTPTPAQMAAMRSEVETAMRAGAFGISTALIYSPHTFQSTGDLIELAKVVSQCGGFYATHMRDESDKLPDAIREAIRIGEEGGVKVEIFHLKAAYRPSFGKLMPEALALINAARDRGVDVAADMYLYDAGGTGLEITVPTWVWADGTEKGIARLRDPAIRARLKKEVAAGSQPGWSNLVTAAGGWDHVALANPFNDKYAKYVGMPMSRIGAELGKDPADAAWDILLEALPNRAYGLYFMMDDKDIETALRQPWVSIGSDAAASETMGVVDGIGLPHPRAYGNAARLISEFVGKRKQMTLEEGVRKMTSWPAQRMGLSDRGLLREGMRADVLLFDPKKVKDQATYQLPLRASEGFDTVIVNGKLTIDDGRMTGARAGRTLRHVCPAS